VSKYGYNGELHEVVTDDGYILELHRITGRTNVNSQVQKPVALVMHGLMCSSACWVVTGPEKGLGKESAFLFRFLNASASLGHQVLITYMCNVSSYILKQNIKLLF